MIGGSVQLLPPLVPVLDGSQFDLRDDAPFDSTEDEPEEQDLQNEVEEPECLSKHQDFFKTVYKTSLTALNQMASDILYYV